MPGVELGLAAKAAGTAGAVGTAGGLFCANYNRANFLYDQGLRFQRFNQSRGFANQQMGQYREDIRGMTEMTSAKMDTIYTVSTLFMCIAAACSCAGRVGMHGAAPPGYLCALFTGHIFTAILYLTLAMWLALHATQRAQCGMTSLLTRKVRLPIPSIAEIDQARCFASGFEKQKWRDIFRIPFCRHPQSAPDAPHESSEEESDDDPADKKKARSAPHQDLRNRFGTTTRSTVPSWIRDEQVQDKGQGDAGTAIYTKSPHEAPDHFKLFANTQLEFYPYDVYARTCMLFGVVQFVAAAMYYCIATTMCELRAVWIVWSIPVVFVAAQVLILRMDTRMTEGQQLLPHLEWAGHLAPYMIIIALTLDYGYTYSSAAVAVAWVFVFLGLISHFLFALRLLDLAWPRIYRETDMPDEPGKPWWPHTWRVPHALSKALWVIAPPAKLEPGQHCLMNEMEAMRRSGGGVSAGSCRKRFKSQDNRVSGTPVPLNDMKRQLRRLDQRLEWWYNVYAQVSETGQRGLDELKFEIERAKREFKLLEKQAKGPSSSSGGKKDGTTDKKNIELASSLNEVEDRLHDMDAKEHIVHLGGGGANGGEDAYTHRSPFRQIDDKDKVSSTLPWRLTFAAIVTVAATWLFVIFGTIIDIAISPDSLLKGPGEPPWIRDQKYRVWNASWIHLSSQPIPSNYRLFSAAVADYEDASAHAHLSFHMPLQSHALNPKAGSHAAGQHAAGDHTHSRRLDVHDSERIELAFQDLAKSLPALGWLSGEMRAQSVKTAESPILAAGDRGADLSSQFLAPAPRVVATSWPAFLEPHHLACSPAVGAGAHVALALTPRGAGVALHLGGGEAQSPQVFALDGVARFGAVVGASWLEDGLWLVARQGHVLQCPGNVPPAAWACSAADSLASLPVPKDVRILAAALGPGREGTAAPALAAMVLENAPNIVGLYEPRKGAGGWSPIGEIHAPSQSTAGHLRLAFDGAELLLLTASGEVHRRATGSAAGPQAARAHQAPGGPAREWMSTCAPPGRSGELLRLALRISDDGTTVPELVSES